MSQLKVNTIRHTGASSDAITLAADGTAAIGECTAKITNNLSNRNLVINGAMMVAQRGTSVTDDGMKTVDRFALGYGGTDNHLTQAQHALTSSDTGPWEKGFRNSFHITNGDQTSGAGTGDHAYYEYTIEAKDIANSGWDYTNTSSYLTLSFWVKSSVAQTFYGYLYTYDGSAQTFSISTGALSANTWKKVTVKIPGHANLQFDNNSAAGLTLYLIWPYCGTDRTTSGHTLNAWQAYSSSNRMPDHTSTWWTTNDATIEITGVQLELGDVATDFEHRSYTDEILRCYRYYYKIADGSVVQDSPVHSGTFFGAHNMYGPIHYPVAMRATPTMDCVTGTGYYQCYYGTSTDAHDAVALNNVSPTSATLNATTNLTGTSGASGWCRTTNTSSYVALTAEL